MSRFSILLVEDELVQREALSAHLESENYKVSSATNASQAMSIFANEIIDLVITDLNLPDENGQHILEKVKEQNPQIPVIMITAYSGVDSAVQAIKMGAYDYIAKPVKIEELFIIIKRALDYKTLVFENEQLRSSLKNEFAFEGIIASGKEMQNVLNMAGRVAASRASVLLQGESGTGKEVIARAIHYASPRKDKPFVAFNVAALTPTLIESELFGHEKGSFTGADRQRIGRFEESDGGTIFIDEIGDIPTTLQTKLLRVLQENYIERIGGNERINIDLRVIAATSRDLSKMIQEGTFRADLYYRLNVVNINLPPLRERKEDIPKLCNYFIDRISKENDKKIIGVSREMMDLLMKYSFPGNIRELENLIERAVILSRGEYIEQDSLPLDILSAKFVDPFVTDPGLEQKVEELEKQMIRIELIRAGGNQSKAARNLKVSERKLRYKIQKYNIN